MTKLVTVSVRTEGVLKIRNKINCLGKGLEIKSGIKINFSNGTMTENTGVGLRGEPNGAKVKQAAWLIPLEQGVLKNMNG